MVRRTRHFPMTLRLPPASWLALPLFLALVTGARAATIRVDVSDASGARLAGVGVEILDPRIDGVTDDRGTVLLRGVPEGRRTVSVSAPGHTGRTVEIDAPDAGTVGLEVILEPIAFRESVTVRGDLLEDGRRRARVRRARSTEIAEVVASDAIGRFPDDDAASAAQRLPGVTTLRDQGEARFVVIRGLPLDFASTTVNGERVPSGEADERIVSLDLFPTEALEAIEIRKTPSPDRDGDAIGGTVNLVTRLPPLGRRAGAALGHGVDDASDGDRSRASAAVGARTGGGGPGFLVAASHLNVDRGIDSFEAVPGDEGPEAVRFQDSTVERRRRGLTGALDLPLGASGSLVLRGIWADLEDREVRRRREHRLEDEALVQELKDRTETQEILSFVGSGQTLLGDSLLLSFRLGWNRAREAEPSRLDAVFVQEGVGFDDSDPTRVVGEDPGESVLEEVRTERDSAQVEGWLASLDVERPWLRAAGAGSVRLGLKVRRDEATRDDNLVVHETEDDVGLLDLVDPSWRPADPFRAGPASSGFDLGLFPSPRTAAELIGLDGLDGEPDLEEDLGDYTATETVSAAYAMIDLPLREHLGLVAGLRWERTETSYSALEIVLDEDDDPVIAPVRGGSAGDELLPMAALRWAPSWRDTFRLSLARTLARPGLEAQAPYRVVLEEDEEILLGNPDLRPTTAWSADLQWDRTVDTPGRLTFGLFAKSLRDVIVTARSEIEQDGDEVVILQPRNAGDAWLVGAELAFETRFSRLPGAWSGLGLSANATWTRAETDLPTRPSTDLPGQAEWVGNVALSYEKRGFSGRLAWTSRDTLIEELGDEPGEDVRLSSRHQVDLALRFQVSRRWSLFAEAVNVTGEPLRRTLGDSRELFLEERYGAWGMAGVRFDF